MSWPEVLVAVLIAFVGSTLQSSIGIGLGILGSPILVLLDDRFAPGPILLSALVLTALITWREGKAIDLRGLQWAFTGRIVGTLVAGAVLAALPAGRMAIVFGGLVLLAVAMNVSGFRFRVRPVALVGAGALSGIMGTIAAVGGPPMALLYQDVKGPRLRATLSSFFLAGTILSLATLFAVGRLGPYELELTLVLLPSIIFGFITSRWTIGIVDRGHTRPAVLALAAVAGLVVIARQLV